jgi:GLPGLI family protein
MKNLVTLALFVFISSLNFVSCQSSKGFEGKIVFGIEYQLSEEFESQRSMLPTESTYFIGKKFTRVDQNSSIGNQSTIYLTKKKQTISLIDFFGQKIAIVQDPEKDAKDLKVEVQSETKEIAGFKCKKAFVYLPAKGTDPEVPVEVYYTEEIGTEYNSQFPGIKGFPIQYELSSQGITMIYTAKTVTREKVDVKLSEIPKDYKQMTVKEFTDMMGGGQ